MSDAIPFVSLTVGTEAGTGAERPTPRAPPIPISIPNPIPPPAHPDRAAGVPDPDPDPGPASGAPSQPLLYLLSKLLHAPHSRFRQIFNNGQDFRYAHVTYDKTGHPGRCAKDTENHIAG